MLTVFYFTGQFLIDNYKQALGILQGEDALKKSMAEHGIAGPEVFKEWLAEERAYLRGLAKEPVEETQEMDYYQALVNLAANQ